MGVGMRVPGLVRVLVFGFGEPPGTAIGQPPAIAGRSLTSSAAVTGVSSPAR